MRRAAEARLWDKLRKMRGDEEATPFDVGDGTTVNLAAPCTILSGRNGAGKSRLLRAVAESLDERALYLDLNHLCEQALIVIRSRVDIEAMTEEVDELGTSTQAQEDLQRVVGRNYQDIQWYALDLEPADPAVADRFRWGGDQALVPYFRVSYRGVSYTAKEMGLGEFSVHFLFWILEQYREKDDLLLLLDEPDAFLPPVGIESLLTCLLKLCSQRGWRTLIATHSEEMIRRAIDEQAFTLVRVNERGEISAQHVADDPMTGSTLLTRPRTDFVIFCEDESAFALTRAILDVADIRLSRRISIVWGDGEGYMRALQRHLPRPPRPDIYFAYVLDGDQHNRIVSSGKWRMICLPTTNDPDTLFASLSQRTSEIADRLGISRTRIDEHIESLEGSDAHDWVNALCEEYGRQKMLPTLAALWAEAHRDQCKDFVLRLRACWE